MWLASHILTPLKDYSTDLVEYFFRIGDGTLIERKLGKPEERRREQSRRLSSVVEELVRSVLLLMEEKQLPLTAETHRQLTGEFARLLTPHISTAAELKRQETALAAGVDLIALDNRLAIWRADNDLVTPMWVMLETGLSDRELRTAEKMEILPYVQTPKDVLAVPEKYHPHEHWRNYRRSTVLELTDEKRREIAASTMLTRTQAAELLDVELGEFGRLQSTYRVPVADSYVTRNGHTATLFRLSDIEALRPHLADHNLDDPERWRRSRA